MKIAAFYENILEGMQQYNQHATEPMSKYQALFMLKEEGLDLLYMDYRLFQQEQADLLPIMADLEIGLEGLYGFYEFGLNPEDTAYISHVDLAASGGADNILVVPGFIKNQDQELMVSQKNNMILALNNIVKYAQSKGIRVSMEDFDNEHSPTNSSKGLKWFMDHVDGLECGFDTGNFIISDEDVLNVFQIFKHNLCTVHLKDRSKLQQDPSNGVFICPDGRQLYATPVGSGDIPIKEILHALVNENYQGNVVVELFDYYDMFEGLKSSIKYIKDFIV